MVCPAAILRRNGSFPSGPVGNRLCTIPSCTYMYAMPKNVMPRPAPKHSPPKTPGVRKPYAHSANAGTPLAMAKMSFASKAPSRGRWCDSCSSQMGRFHSLRVFRGIDQRLSCHRYLCA